MAARIIVRTAGQAAPRRGDLLVIDGTARRVLEARPGRTNLRLPSGATAYRVDLADGASPPPPARRRLARTGLTYPCRRDGCAAGFDTGQGRAIHELGHDRVPCPECGKVCKGTGLGSHRWMAHGIRAAAHPA